MKDSAHSFLECGNASDSTCHLILFGLVCIFVGLQDQWNPDLGFIWGAVDLNNKLSKTLNGRNLTLRLLTWSHWNWMLNEGKPKIEEQWMGAPLYITASCSLMQICVKQICLIVRFRRKIGLLKMATKMGQNLKCVTWHAAIYEPFVNNSVYVE
jgi:hypothetical protein